MRPDLAVTTALLLLLGTGVARAANSVQLAETAGFLLGNAHRCGVPTDRVEHAGKVVHRLTNFEAYRPAEAISLGVDDAYLVGEPENIRCDAGTMTPEAMLIVEEAATGRQVFKGNLVPQSNEPISVEN